MQAQANSLVDLRSRRAALNARLSKGLDALRQKEDAGDTGPEYERWLSAWLGLLAEYEGVCEQIDACRAQAARPAPTLSEIPAAAMGAAWRVGLRAPGVFSSQAQVVGLARQLTIFAGSTPVMGLPAGVGGEQDEQSTDEN
jgi:hypothetical protein